ncbi:MAG: hypothetical protein ACE5GC_02095 [Acidimicrobiia bacterium]
MRDHDSLASLQRELRARVGDDYRRAAEEQESAARILRTSRRTLEEVAFDMLSRGDIARVGCGSDRVEGPVVDAAGSLATLLGPGNRLVHVNLDGPITLSVVARSKGSGRSRSRYGASSMQAKLRQLEREHRGVTLCLATGTVTGEILVVAKDHVVIDDRDGTRWFLRFGRIGTVARS